MVKWLLDIIAERKARVCGMSQPALWLAFYDVCADSL